LALLHFLALTPHSKQTCKGFPRNKVHNGDWIAESSYYSYNFNTEYACREGQRAPGQAPGAPMATASPGDTLLMRFWGNGHSRWDIGSPNHRDPGLVRIFWAGKPETEIVKAVDLTEEYWIPGAQGNFSGDAVTEITNGGKNMNEKANYFTFTLPEKIQNGRHMMVWAWAWKASLVDGEKGDPNVYDASWDNAWGTCFDIQIENSSYKGAPSCLFLSLPPPPTAPANIRTEKANTDILCNKPGYSKESATRKTASATCSQTCYKGGMVRNDMKCTGSGCPPCWYKNADYVTCYDYDSAGKCPFAGAFDCKTGSYAATKRDVLSQHRKHRRHNRKN